MTPELFAVTDDEYYAPLSALAGRPPQPAPAGIPQGWSATRTGLWTLWSDGESGTEADTGFTVCVAAEVERIPETLDVLAGVCFERRIPFRHVADEAAYRHIRGRRGSAALADRFGVAHPATVAEGEALAEALTREPVFEHVVGSAPAPAPVLLPDGVWRPVMADSLCGRFLPRPIPPAGHRLLRRLGAGGTHQSYLAADPEDREVFVKQAHRSRYLDDEWRMLRALYEAAPGLGPHPLARRSEDGREYLIVEAVSGVPPQAWVVMNTPLTDPGATAAEWAGYHRRVDDVVSQLRRGVERLRALGPAEIVIEATDILIERDDTVRLTGFRAGAARPAPGVDRVAFEFLSALGAAADQSPDVLPHILRDLRRRGPVPEPLWQAVTRGTAPSRDSTLPSPEEVDRDERAALAELRDGIVADLLAAARDGGSDSVFPTVPQGYETNTLGVAFGTAGVVHALRTAGAGIPHWILEQLRRDALEQAATLPPGLYSGLAGIAWVLADHGHLDEAAELLHAADGHPLTRGSATLAWGAAGVATAHLALFRHTGDERHLDRACALTDFPDGYRDLVPLLGPDDSTGLWYGRTGLAHALQQVAAVTEDEVLRKAGLALLHTELDRATVQPDGRIVFPASAGDRRILYYLHRGTAGFLLTAARYLAVVPDERLNAALPGLVAQCDMTYVAHAGLGQGLAGLGHALAETGRILGDESASAAAWRSARGLFQHAIPARNAVSGRHAATGRQGIRFLGDLGLRTSCDLWSGSAGVLLFLTTLLDPVADPLFTVDGAF